MSDTIDEKTLQIVNDLIITHTGILYDDNHTADLTRHIISACKELRIPVSSCSERLQELAFVSGFLEVLINYITIGETYFFRDKNLFSHLRDSLIPSLVQERREGKKLFLRIWIAACSSGEEPYSIALLLKHLLPDIEDWDIFILGTDINQKVLDRAHEGVYSRWSFRDNPIVSIGQYFTPTPDSKMKIDDSIRAMVRFERMNLIGDSRFYHALGPSSLDLIFCRNVLMYFSKTQSYEVVSRLIDSLRTGGFLVVAPQEIGILSNHSITMLHHGSVFLHVKSDRIPSFITSVPTISHPDANNDEPEFFETEEPEVLPYSHPAIQEEDVSTPIPPVIASKTGDDNFEILIAENKLTEAGQILGRNAYADNPRMSKQIEMLIRAYAGNGEYEPALGWSDRMIAAETLNPRPYLLKAAVLDEQGLFAQSLQSLHQSLYANPDYLPAHLAIAGIYAKTGKADMARHHYEIAIHVLDTISEDKILEETEGIPAQKMKDMIQMLLGG